MKQTDFEKQNPKHETKDQVAPLLQKCFMFHVVCSMSVDNFAPDHSDMFKPQRRKTKLIILGVILAIVFSGAFFVYQASNILTIAGSAEGVGIYKGFKIDKEKDRLDILLLGIRGAGDPNGGLLADTMVLLSIDKEKHKVAMLSLPRDLFVEMPEHQPEKINFAYALGEQRKSNGGGLILSKEVVKYVTGVYVDYAVVINHEGFKEIIDIMGGVTIYRDTPFYETQQWQGERVVGSPYWYKQTVKQEISVQETGDSEQETVDGEEEVDNQITENSEQPEGELKIAETPQEYWVFHVPAGTSTLYGDDTLYYVRSRYSSNDFDRIRRQQQVLEALKNKAFSLGVISNPIKVFDILDTIGNNMRTDMGLGDIREVVSLAQEYSKVEIQGGLLDTSETSLLKSSTVRGSYVLIPKSEDFSEIRNYFQNIFE